MPQIKTDKQPVTQITMIDAEPGKQAEALSIMTERARFMAHQPGCISISLHRSLDGRRIVNYVQWEAPDLLRAAHQSPEFHKAWNRFGKLTDGIDPHLYEVAEIIDEASLAVWREQRKGGSVKVRDAMTPNVQICAPQDSIKDAAEAMTALNVGLLPVADGDRLVGMISDRDITTRGVAMSQGPDTPVRDVMTVDVKYCFEDQ